MNCKKCNVDLTNKEYRKVAEWNFCLDCFNEIISPGLKKDQVQQKTPEQYPEPGLKSRNCVICEKELDHGNGHDLLGSLFCEECYENLVKMPLENESMELDDSQVEVNDKKGVAQVRVDFISQTRCYLCGRTIRAVAAREHLGHLYCPDCYFNIPEIKNPPPQALVDAFPHVDLKQDIKEESADGTVCPCQACQRTVLREDIKAIDGFEICKACIAADPDTALDIARLRHRRRLEEMKKQLLKE